MKPLLTLEIGNKFDGIHALQGLIYRRKVPVEKETVHPGFYDKLFAYMDENYNMQLLNSDMDEICQIVQEMINPAEKEAAHASCRGCQIATKICGECYDRVSESNERKNYIPSPVSVLFHLPAVEGRIMDCSNAEFEHRCLIALNNEQEKISPDNSLIALFCDAVRCVREYSDRMQSRSTPAPTPKQDAPGYTVEQIGHWLEVACDPEFAHDLMEDVDDPQDGIKAVTERNRKEGAG